jgi:hypothetical protein
MAAGCPWVTDGRLCEAGSWQKSSKNTANISAAPVATDDTEEGTKSSRTHTMTETT